ncbi:uncharacterized protein LOC120068023 [Benincasa hispida]|uniref:uncharacterized protein LOC120068023 n=1 Tax=Benincasa hispida TaxID=102211 RepID=UPI001900F7B9|nr:uncharacterized protein LOC120068023 [Benincasa hispida]XP_038875619.1 uncharacterized protein LOC120068023 [Benincasa hispida]XP_038875620.1 uncharacterized protein LOC120068023 [Benincasa hispida]
MLPPGGAPRKRKEVEPFVKPKVVGADSISANRLLAGYLAHEFLNNGTLFGEKYEPAQSEVVGMANLQSTECKRTKPEAASPSIKKGNHSYAEVASILKMDGAHLPGIVNPAQLAWWIKM